MQVSGSPLHSPEQAKQLETIKQLTSDFRGHKVTAEKKSMITRIFKGVTERKEKNAKKEEIKNFLNANGPASIKGYIENLNKRLSNKENLSYSEIHKFSKEIESLNEVLDELDQASFGKLQKELQTHREALNKSANALNFKAHHYSDYQSADQRNKNLEELDQLLDSFVTRGNITPKEYKDFEDHISGLKFVNTLLEGSKGKSQAKLALLEDKFKANFPVPPRPLSSAAPVQVPPRPSRPLPPIPSEAPPPQPPSVPKASRRHSTESILTSKPNVTPKPGQPTPPKFESRRTSQNAPRTSQSGPSKSFQNRPLPPPKIVPPPRPPRT